ncbi:MAG: family 1 glycosylhydrolase, partial [Gemmatimonadaceae bacterium]
MADLDTAMFALDVKGASRAVGVEMWAGLECTINRVGDRYFDQLARSGHYTRAADIDRLADLGIRTLRYPVLWERHASNDEAWRVTDAAMTRMKERDIDPIVGLVHHGSGPSGTSIISGNFAEGLAHHANRVARRYPWVKRYTPINEPLTTARFACLYGHWYPHLRDDAAFVCAILEQTRGTQLAMRSIRRVRSDAQLIQTEDLGHTHATPPLHQQGEFENARRWLTMDLLLGRVVAGHGLHRFLARSRECASHLDEISAAPCPPDLIGINHYVTSERFLDHRVERYPVETHGGNGRQRYADVEAIRALEGGVLGARRLLQLVWERYGLPMAITEAHLGCSREQQLCWLGDLVRAAGEAREDGADIRAVTAWAAFGSFDWPSLLTREEGCYESGLFDIRSHPPRPTALARMVEALARDGIYDHPVLDAPGWWNCNRRLTFAREPRPSERPCALNVASADGRENFTAEGRENIETQRSRSGDSTSPPHRAMRSRFAGRSASASARRILLTGAAGTLGRAFQGICAERQLALVAVSRGELD